MGCPVIRFLPEIVAISERLKHSRSEMELLAVAERICWACRGKMPEGQCPLLGEALACNFQDYLPSLVEMVQKNVREEIDQHG